MDLPPALRANVDYVFILRENIIQNREKLYKSFFGIFPSYDMFSQVMDACTENFEILVLDNTSRSNKIEDVVYWYKAKLHSPGSFRIGAKEFWQCHDNRYNRNYDDSDETLDARKNRKIPTINIKKTN